MKTKTILGLLMLLTAACKSKDDTMIVVEVSSDLAVPSELASVRIDVTGPTASTSKSYKLSGSNPLPVHLALVPDSGDADMLMVRATGLLDGYEFVSQAAWVAFVPGESKLLKLFLGNPCAYAGCGPTQSCSAGVCSSVPTISKLPDYNPKATVSASGGKGGAVGGMGGAPTIAGNGGRPGGAMAGQGGTFVPFGGTGGVAGFGGIITGGVGGTSSIGGTCAVAQACGGDLVGKWGVTSSCLNYSGYVDIAYLGLTCVPNTAKITGSVSVSGSLTFNANGRYTDTTVTTGSETWELDSSCLNLSGTKVTCQQIGSTFAGSLSTFGYDAFSCTSSANGGCTCRARINQPGGMGLLSNEVTSTGSYKTSYNTVYRDDGSSYSFCASGNNLTMVPNSSIGTPYVGNVVLQKTCSGTACTGGVGGSGGSGGTGGTKSSGGSTSSSTGSCPTVAACGGDVVGTWNVASSCLRLDGLFQTRGTGLGCDTFKVTGSLQVKGSFVATADKKFQDKTTTSGPVTVSMDHQCLWMSGTWTQCDLISVAVEGLGFKDVKCTDAPGGGCTCPGTINHPGSMGLIVAEEETSGFYTLSGTTLNTGENPLTGAALDYSYCASGNSFTVTPKTSSPPTTGTILFQKASGGSGGNGGSSGTGGTGGSTSTAVPPPPAFTGLPLPCEVVAKDGGGAKCVTAHSTVRAIVPGYTGPLYQLCKGSSSPGPNSCRGTVQDIPAKDGYADADAHDAFCGSESCTITKIYDQSGMGNDLEPAPKGGAKGTPDNPSKAMALPIKINGHRAYGLLIKAGMGYRTGCNGCNLKKTNGMPMGDEPQTVYMVTSQKDLIDGCCFDYGNAETTSNDDGNGMAEAVYFGGGVVWGTGVGGKPGPWVMADLENGTYAGWENEQDKSISTNLPLKFDFVTAVVVGDTADKNNGKGRFALYGADAQGVDVSLGKLTCMYDGIRPEKPGYVPMQKQGSLILGTGTDNSNGAGGRFFEGATIAGPLVSKTTLSLLHAVIVAAKYENAN